MPIQVTPFGPVPPEDLAAAKAQVGSVLRTLDPHVSAEVGIFATPAPEPPAVSWREWTPQRKPAVRSSRVYVSAFVHLTRVRGAGSGATVRAATGQALLALMTDLCMADLRAKRGTVTG